MEQDRLTGLTMMAVNSSHADRQAEYPGHISRRINYVHAQPQEAVLPVIHDV